VATGQERSRIPRNRHSPQVRINPDNIREVSEDGGIQWESTDVGAVGPPGDTFFREDGIDTITNPFT
jgi:hypothetical protein